MWILKKFRDSSLMKDMLEYWLLGAFVILLLFLIFMSIVHQRLA